MSDQLNHSDQADSGSFITGFTLGLLAGAAGYFLFATDRGVSVRKELAKEWQQAKQDLIAAEVVPDTAESVKDWLLKQLRVVSGKLDDTKKAAVAKSPRAKATKGAKKFKGT